jgi:uncharacterized membrane protein YphA (DoxX/SURF4 family)
VRSFAVATAKNRSEGGVVMNGINDELILAARLLLTTLFLIFGWRKLRDYSGTISQMVQLGAPMPVLAAAAATFMELPVAFAVAIGAFVRPLALLLVLYTLGTALLGIAIGPRKMRIESIAWMAFTKISALWEASCCCTLLVRDNIRSMHCAVLPRHNAFVSLAASHRSLLKLAARRILANR